MSRIVKTALVLALLIVLIDSIPAKGLATVDTLVVPPYLEVVVFDVFRGSAADVEVFAPGSATPIGSGVGGVEYLGLGDVLTTIVVPHPPPGQWLIRKSRVHARVRIRSQQFFPRGSLVRPSATDLRQHDRIRIGYRLAGSDGQPLAELRDYPLALELTLARPDGIRTVLAMERDPREGPMVFRSRDEAVCELAGHYWTDVRITTLDDEGRRLEVFRDRWSGFSVTPAVRVDCRVSTSGIATWWPMTARLICVQTGGQPIEMAAIANGPPVDLFRVALFREGRPIHAALDLHDDGLGAFRGRLRGADSDGAYRLQLSVDRARLRPPYNVCFAPPELSFVRRTRLTWLVMALGISAMAVVIALLRRRTPTRS